MLSAQSFEPLFKTTDLKPIFSACLSPFSKFGGSQKLFHKGYDVKFIDGQFLCDNEYIWTKWPGLEASFTWKSYIVSQQLLIRLIPTFLLIFMNVAIIRSFNLSIQRKKRLRARKFVQRTSSKLFPKRGSKFFEAVSKATATNADNKKRQK